MLKITKNIIIFLLVFAFAMTSVIFYSSQEVNSATSNIKIRGKIKVRGGGTNSVKKTFAAPGNTGWQVPSGVTSIIVKAWGAAGENNHGFIGAGGAGGGGGFAQATITVTPGEVLNIYVGGAGTGTNGGGGGGYSAVTRGAILADQTTTLIQAGGGGGGGRGANPGVGGDGGPGGGGSGVTGGTGTSTGGGVGGGGGTSSAGGAGGTGGGSGADGQAGSANQGGAGGAGGGGCSGVNGGGDCSNIAIRGGGGGGGYYGGGGGEDGVNATGGGGGGGGGSSFVGCAGCSNTVEIAGSGAIPGNTTDVDYVYPFGYAGNPFRPKVQNEGADGYVVIRYTLNVSTKFR